MNIALHYDVINPPPGSAPLRETGVNIALHYDVINPPPGSAPLYERHRWKHGVTL